MNKERGAFITLHRPKLKLQKLTIYKCFMSIWFVLLCRPISIYYFSQEGSLNSIYIWISRILSLKIIPVYEKDKMRAGVIDESIGPREFVEYFYNASFVCTDSFHGTAFSLIFNKKMLVFERFSNKEKENQNSRIYNILSKFNLKNRLYNESTYQHEIMEEINYQCVNEILTKERKKSENYLLNAIEAAGGSEIDKDNSVDRRNTPCCGCGACQYVYLHMEDLFWL